MFDCQHGRCGCVSSILSSSHYRTVQCKTLRSSCFFVFFSFIGSLSHSDKWHHHSGTRRICLLSFTGTSCRDDSFRSEWLAPASPGDLWPRLQGFNSARSLSQVLWESFTRWMFNVAELCFVKCVFMPMLQESEDPSWIHLWLSLFSTSQFSDQEKPVEASRMNVSQVNVVAQCVWIRLQPLVTLVEEFLWGDEYSGRTEEDICFQWWSKCIALSVCVCVFFHRLGWKQQSGYSFLR